MTRALLAALSALGGAASAHPHAFVDQQVQLTLGLDRAVVTVVIVPSVEEGPAIFDRVDADGDGAVSDAEARALASAVVADLSLTLDGETLAFGAATAGIAPAPEVQAGTGGLSVTAEAPLALAADAPHIIAFAVAYDDLAPGWFVQPYYRADLRAAFGVPLMERSADGARVTIGLEP